MTVPLDPALTVLHGNNAHGKTSLLAAIAVGLGVIPTILTGSGGIAFRKSDIRQGKGFVEVLIETSDGLKWARSDSEHSGVLRADRGPSPGVSALRDYLKSVAEDIKAQRPATLPVFAYYDTDRAVFDVPQRRRDFHDAFERYDAYVNALAPKPSFKALVEWFYVQQYNEMYELLQGGRRDNQPEGLTAVRTAITRMLPDVSDPRIEPPVRFVVSRRGEGGQIETLSLDQLSGGYRIVLALAADLARRIALANPHLPDPLQSEAIVLIDELELHLHPEWQQRVIGDLRQTFPNAQFIVSTHSPAVLTTVEPHHSLHLRATPDGVVAEQETGATFGAKAGDVLEAVMHVNQRPDNAFAQTLSECRSLIATGHGDAPAAAAGGPVPRRPCPCRRRRGTQAASHHAIPRATRMKRAAGLPSTPDGLLRFRTDKSATQTWTGFGSFEAGAAKRELTRDLVTCQFGLCCYCEISLREDDIQLEHFIPRSDPSVGAALEPDERNLLAACKGGSNANFAASTRLPDPSRFLPPVRSNLSCGSAKGDRPAAQFLDPRTLPARPPLVRVDLEGALLVDPEACASAGSRQTVSRRTSTTSD